RIKGGTVVIHQPQFSKTRECILLMDVSREAGFLLAEYDYRVLGNIHRIEGLKADSTLGASHKGHSQESQDNKCKHFVHHIFFLLLINMLAAPPGTFLRDRTLNAPDGATVVPAEK